jgi:HAE1 family hydrophobic/amphiphilic exporter-1
MFISNVSIKRPVFTTMLNLVLIVFGLFSLPRLAVDQFPNVDFPVVTVTVIYPGADPESIEQRVLDPLEDAVNGIAGLENLSSNAYPNLAQIILQFKLEKNSDQAAQEVRDKIFAAVGELPDEAETPIVQKFDIGGEPILNIAVTGSSIPFAQLSGVAKDVVQPALERVDGVAMVNTAGIREREVQIMVDRKRLAGLNLTPIDIVNSVQQQNMDLPVGKIENDANYWSLRVKGRLSTAEQIGLLPVISSQPVNLRIADVAEVRDTIAEEETAAFVDNSPTILMSLQKQSGANTTEVADSARIAIDKVKNQLPKGVNIEIVSDNSKYIKGSIDSVKLDLMLGAVLATFIVFVFLRNFWITVISAVALPTAVVATFAFLDFMGFTLNMMTTLGLSLSIGILIDDAIIVIENIHRHLTMGKTGAKAAEDATSEIGLAVIATTMTICAVFVPVAFMEGIIGRFFYQFGLTVTFAVLISLFVAFTMSPMLSSRLLGESHDLPRRPLLRKGYLAIENALTKLDNFYKAILNWCLDHRKTTLAMGAAMFVLSIFLLRFVPVAFFPKEDRSQFNITYTMPEGTTLDVTKAKSLQISETIKKYPGVSRVVVALGATAEKKPNMARFDVILVDVEDRNYSQEDIMNRMRQDFGPIFAKNDAEFVVSEAGGGGGGHTEPIQFIFKSDNWESLVKFTDQVAKFISENVEGAADVNTTKPKVQREFQILLDPAMSADVGMSAAQIGTAIRALYEGDKVGEIDDETGSYDVRMRIADSDRVSPQDLASVILTNRMGAQLTLGSVATIKEAESPAAIARFNGQRQITVLSNFTGKDLNKASDTITTFIDKNMPPEVTVSLSGQTEIMKDAIVAMLKALGIAILLVFMILCAQYERYLAPLVIMAALPLSLTGAFGSLLVTGQTMSVYTMIGIILLMGIVTKNGILLIDFTLQRINEGKSVKEALLEAGPIRLRPILMTTFAAGGGMLPVAIGHGVGGEARSPMGVAVIGGLLMSTILTLVVVPCLFSIIEDWRSRRKNKKKRSWFKSSKLRKKDLATQH